MLNCVGEDDFRVVIILFQSKYSEGGDYGDRYM